MKFYFILFVLFTLPYLSFSQQLMGIQTQWTDSFAAWTIFTDDEETEGSMAIRWINQNDWTEWTYEVGTNRGSIELRSSNMPDQWEVRGAEGIISIRKRWGNDLTEWKITDNSSTFVFKSRWRNSFNEWSLADKQRGDFIVKAAWDDDPRQWDIFDELDEEISFELKMAMVFVATYYSSPKL